MANPTCSLVIYRFDLLKTSFLCWLFVILFSLSGFSQQLYRTRTGEKYHEEGCRYLSQSKIECTLQEALDAGLTPCSVCKPTTESEQQPVKSNTSQSTISTQCTAKTKAGARCSRMTKEANGRCWQHQ